MSAVPKRSPMLVALRPPRQYDRKGRIELIGEAARALRDGRPVSREAALFLGGALLAWLEHGRGGGDLATRFLAVVKRQSRHTPQALWKLIAYERQAQAGERIIAPTASIDEESEK
jgi:hypothetical protein